MSKSDWFAPYYGNKYKESEEAIEKGIKGVDWSKVKYIVEPFCGSAGFSRYIFHNVKEYEGKFLWCDVDEGLINFYKLIKDGKFAELFKKVKEASEEITDKEKFNTYRDNLDPMTGEGWYLSKRVRGGFRENLHCQVSIDRLKTLKAEKWDDLIKFIESERVEVMCQTSEETVKTVQKLTEEFGDKSVVVFCDPPYFQSCNSFYAHEVKHHKEQAREKGTNRFCDPDQSIMFVDILNLLKNNKSITLAVINHTHLMAELYNGFVKHVYKKTYNQLHHNKITGETYLKYTKHMTLSNFDIIEKEEEVKKEKPKRKPRAKKQFAEIEAVIEHI